MDTTTTEIMRKKNFNLTEDEFDTLCDQLKNGDESLFEKIFLAHFADCISFLKSKFRMQHEEAYDVTMETLLDFRVAIIRDKISYGNIRFLFTRMASQKYIRSQRKEIVTQEIHSDTDILMGGDEPAVDADDLIYLDKAWAKLGENCQQLLKSFYYDKVKLNEIAAYMEKSAPAARKQKERCLNLLRNNFIQILNH